MRLFKLYTDWRRDKANAIYINEETIESVRYEPERDRPIYSPNPNITEPIDVTKEGGYLVFYTKQDSYYWPGTMKEFKEQDAYDDYLNIEII